MKTGKQKNYAFIDSQNLNLSIQRLGWKLDFHRFRVYLRANWSIKKAPRKDETLKGSFRGNSTISIADPSVLSSPLYYQIISLD